MVVRVLALLAAVGMVAGALAVRNRMEADDPPPADAPLVVCAADVEAACNAFGNRARTDVEPAGTTAGRVGAAAGNGDEAISAWLSPLPWADVARAAAGQRAARIRLTTEPSPVARSPLVAVVATSRAPVVQAACGGGVTWRCLGDLAGKGEWAAAGGPPEWGLVRLGLPDPVSEASGLAALGAATAGFFGRTDLSAFDLEDPAYGDWVSAVARAVPRGASLEKLVLTNGAEVQIFLTTEAHARAVLGGGGSSERATLIYPSPVATADVLVAYAPDDAGSRARRAVADSDVARALGAAGWRLAGDGRAPALPAGSGQPSPGLLEALRQTWREVAR